MGPKRSRNGLVSAPQWEALCLACTEKLLCLLLLIFSGMSPSQWQKEPLHNVMPFAKELQRGCVALLRVKKTPVSKPKQRSPSAGSRVFSAADAKWGGYENVTEQDCAETNVNTLCIVLCKTRWNCKKRWFNFNVLVLTGFQRDVCIIKGQEALIIKQYFM